MESTIGKVLDLGGLYRRFGELCDLRKAKGKRFALATILLGIMLAKLCGEDKPSGIAEWVRLRGPWLVDVLRLKRSEMPSHHTYRRVLASGVATEELEAVAREQARHCGESGYHVVVSMDGKVLRGAVELEESEGVCLLAAYLPGEEITLAQVAVSSHHNEIVAAPLLLECIDLRNKVVVADALHTQRQISIQIGKAGGHYLWSVKGNQPQLLRDLQDWFDPAVELLAGMDCPAKDFRSASMTSKEHGRLEVRRLTTSSQMNDFLNWPFLQQVFKLERSVTYLKNGKTSHEIRYGITSLPAEQASPQQLLQMLRSYWQIENSLHYTRDVTLHEDQTRFKHPSAARNMATINNLILGLLHRLDFPFIPSARRLFAAHPERALHLLLGL